MDSRRPAAVTTAERRICSRAYHGPAVRAGPGSARTTTSNSRWPSCRAWRRYSGGQGERTSADSERSRHAGPPGGVLARVVRAIEATEDIIHVVVGILLTVLGIVLIVDTVRYVAVVLAGPYNLPVVVLAILERDSAAVHRRRAAAHRRYRGPTPGGPGSHPLPGGGPGRRHPKRPHPDRIRREVVPVEPARDSTAHPDGAHSRHGPHRCGVAAFDSFRCRAAPGSAAISGGKGERIAPRRRWTLEVLGVPASAVTISTCSRGRIQWAQARQSARDFDGGLAVAIRWAKIQ